MVTTGQGHGRGRASTFAGAAGVAVNVQCDDKG